MKATPNEKATSSHNRSVPPPPAYVRPGKDRGLRSASLASWLASARARSGSWRSGGGGAYPRKVRELTKALATEVTDLIGE